MNNFNNDSLSELITRQLFELEQLRITQKWRCLEWRMWLRSTKKKFKFVGILHSRLWKTLEDSLSLCLPVLQHFLEEPKKVTKEIIKISKATRKHELKCCLKFKDNNPKFNDQTHLERANILFRIFYFLQILFRVQFYFIFILIWIFLKRRKKNKF